MKPLYGFYKHYRGDIYYAFSTVTHWKNSTSMFLYQRYDYKQNHYNTTPVFTRPREHFSPQFGKFQYIGKILTKPRK